MVSDTNMSIIYQQQLKLTHAEKRTKNWACGSPVIFPDCGSWKTSEKQKRLSCEIPTKIICKNCGQEKKLNLSPFQIKSRKFCDEKCYLEYRKYRSGTTPPCNKVGKAVE